MGVGFQSVTPDPQHQPHLELVRNAGSQALPIGSVGTSALSHG